MTDKNSVFAHIVSYNSGPYIDLCLEALLAQKGFIIGENLTVLVSDNASSDDTLAKAQTFKARGVHLTSYQQNFGFCAGHNLGILEFLKTKAKLFLCLNADLALDKSCLLNLCLNLQNNNKIGTVCPKLLRANEQLRPLTPAIIDAAGMHIVPSLRHFDIGSGEIDNGQYDMSAYVFGGSGACLLMRREFIEDVALPVESNEASMVSVYPQYQELPVPRRELFDEAFFAYREDADLAWRGQRLGWKCLYAADAVAYHVRKVVPEKRSQLSSQLNLLGVKNRFLLQLNNYYLSYGLKIFLCGYLLRNVLVVLAVVLKEQSSLPAFTQAIRMTPQALRKRRALKARARLAVRDLVKWFAIKSESL